MEEVKSCFAVGVRRFLCFLYGTINTPGAILIRTEHRISSQLWLISKLSYVSALPMYETTVRTAIKKYENISIKNERRTQHSKHSPRKSNKLLIFIYEDSGLIHQRVL